MRKLETHDVFKAMRVVNALGVREEVKKIALDVQNGKIKDQQEIGADMVLSIIGHAGDERVEMQIYDLLGGFLEESPEALYHMDPLALVEKIKAYVEFIDREAWLSFFHSLASMMR